MRIKTRCITKPVVAIQTSSEAHEIIPEHAEIKHTEVHVNVEIISDVYDPKSGKGTLIFEIFS